MFIVIMNELSWDATSIPTLVVAAADCTCTAASSGAVMLCTADFLTCFLWTLLFRAVRPPGRAVKRYSHGASFEAGLTRTVTIAREK
jgi:hypothetical protein